MKVSSLGLLAVFFAPAFAARKPCVHKVKESIYAPPRGWVKHGSPPSDHTIRLRIGLTQPNFTVLENHLMEISDPDNERYGQHLSKEEVDRLVAPSENALSLVNEWLSEHGFSDEEIERTAAKDWVTISVPVSKVEKMLDTTFYVWKHDATGDHLVRTTSWSLPEDLHEHIEVIQPTTLFSSWKGMRSTIFWDDSQEHAKALPAPYHNPSTGTTVDPACNVSITVSCLKQLYNIPSNYKPKAAKKGSIAITSYLEQYANIADLQSFYADQVPEAVNSTFNLISVKGGLNEQDPALAGIEANLDTQFAFGLSFPIPATVYTTAGRPPFIPDLNTPQNTNEPYLDWVDYVLSHPNTPHVISTSYGEEEQTIPLSYSRRVCNSFAQLGARGVSLVFSSGDGGVGDRNPDPATQICLTNDGRNITRFMPTFPATCPFVTSVGGTVNVPEIAVFFSGGGFSDRYDRPAWQENAVKKFLKTLPKDLYKGLYNPAGRAFPDVAAQGRRFRVWYQGGIISVGGTSASSPTFAGVVALLNDARFAKNLPPLGWLNPLLYSPKIAAAFNDITEGSNPGCGTPGFNATTGWDPVTGLGTPNFLKLKELLA